MKTTFIIEEIYNGWLVGICCSWKIRDEQHFFKTENEAREFVKAKLEEK